MITKMFHSVNGRKRYVNRFILMRKLWLHLRPGSHPPRLYSLKIPTNKLSHTLTTPRDNKCPLINVLSRKVARFKRKLFLKTRDDREETKTGKALMEHISYAHPLVLHGLSMDNSGAHFRDALRLGLPFHLDAAYLDPVHGQRLPYRQFPCFPFHGPLGVCDYSFEPAFIRKRNERERHRVRCVNEGYARLREHLPQDFEDKRLSKVETLRAAIDYIKHLQSLLDLNVSGMEVSLGDARNREPLPQRTECNSDGESKTGLSDSGDIVY